MSKFVPQSPSTPYLLATTEMVLVETFLRENNIIVGADGIPRKVFPANESIGKKLRRQIIDEKIMLDEMLEIAHRCRLAFKATHISRAIRLTLRERGRERYASHLEPLYAPLSSAEKVAADEQFAKFARLFNCAPTVAITGMKQFIWAVKTKQIGGKVGQPMMLIFWNDIQGSGKSELVLRLLAPLDELASNPTPFDEVPDSRSGELFRHAVVNIDDAGPILPRHIAALKSAISAHAFQRRVLGTSVQRRIENRATLIGTTNENILTLVPDPTGHRRFLALPFRNGEVEKGGDPEVWKIMDELDYRLLWRAVSIDEPEPAVVLRRELFAYQRSYLPPNPLDIWLKTFDFDAETSRNVTTRHGIPASMMYKLYSNEVRLPMHPDDFYKALSTRFDDGVLPMVRKRIGSCVVYSAKPSSPDQTST